MNHIWKVLEFDLVHDSWRFFFFAQNHKLIFFLWHLTACLISHHHLSSQKCDRSDHLRLWIWFSLQDKNGGAAVWVCVCVWERYRKAGRGELNTCWCILIRLVGSDEGIFITSHLPGLLVASSCSQHIIFCVMRDVWCVRYAAVMCLLLNK